VVGDLLDAVVGDVADPDSAPRRLLMSDVVVADAARGHDPERGKSREVIGLDSYVCADQKGDDVVPHPGFAPGDDVEVQAVQELSNPFDAKAGIAHDDSHRRTQSVISPRLSAALTRSCQQPGWEKRT
jgi:hypothetical protein